MRDVATTDADSEIGTDPADVVVPRSSVADRVIGALVEAVVMTLLALVSLFTRIKPPRSANGRG